MPPLTEWAPAKVNLTLALTGRRADGYHLLDSLVVFGPACDRLRAKPAPELTLALEGPFADGLQAEPDNLVLRAARALAAAARCHAGAALVLEKHLPVASGIGGGSADAAATLRLLSRLWGVSLPDAEMAGLAAALGADVPACLHSRPAVMRGVGELLGPAPALPPCGLLLVNPGLPLATAAVFQARTGPFSTAPAWPPGWTDVPGMAAELAQAGNDLQAPAIAICPAITTVLHRLHGLPGARLARMSGSGATCFALFDTAAAAGHAASSLPLAWWTAAGPLYAG